MLGSLVNSEAPVRHTSRVASHVEPLQQADGFFGKQAACAAKSGRNVVSWPAVG
jgi:hypothetical protein